MFQDVTTASEPIFILLNTQDEELKDKLTDNWRDMKLAELNFIGVVSALIASVLTSTGSWPTILQNGTSQPWTVRSSWYCGTLFSMTSVLLAASQTIRLHRLSAHGDCAARLRALLGSKKPNSKGYYHPKILQAYFWQMAVWFLALSVLAMLNGLFILVWSATGHNGLKKWWNDEAKAVHDVLPVLWQRLPEQPNKDSSSKARERDSEEAEEPSLKRLRRTKDADDDETYEDVGQAVDEVDILDPDEDDTGGEPYVGQSTRHKTKSRVFQTRRDKSGIGSDSRSQAARFTKENIASGFASLVSEIPWIHIESDPMLKNVRKFNSFKDSVTLARLQKPTPSVEPVPVATILQSPIQGNRNYVPKWRSGVRGKVPLFNVPEYRGFKLRATDTNSNVYANKTYKRRKAHMDYDLPIESFSEEEAVSILETLCEVYNRWPLKLNIGAASNKPEKMLMMQIAIFGALPAICVMPLIIGAIPG